MRKLIHKQKLNNLLITFRREDSVIACQERATLIISSFKGNIEIINGTEKSSRCDGLISANHTKLLLQTADCIPTIVSWEKSKWAGLLHLHFRGLFLGLVRNFAKEASKNNLPLDKCEIILGPSICEECYTNKTVIRKFKWLILKIFFPEFANKAHGKYTFDVPGAYIKQLVKAGVKREKIRTLHRKYCTSCKLKLSRHNGISRKYLTTEVQIN